MLVACGCSEFVVHDLYCVVIGPYYAVGAICGLTLGKIYGALIEGMVEVYEPSPHVLRIVGKSLFQYVEVLGTACPVDAA